MAVLPLCSSEGLAPNRNLVLWPYSQIHDARFELHDDIILVHGQAATQAFKIGNLNQHGWIAYTLGKILFIKRFSFDKSQSYPDMGCNVEAYVKDVCIELETLGSLVKLNPNESVTQEEIWEVITDTEYPATIESARAISARFSSK
jgi:hypothetical protein